jgi:glycogen operon protein
MKIYTVSSGRSYPLGATCKEYGTNFAVFSANAEKVELCIFDKTGTQEIQRIALPEFTDKVWHGFVKGLPAGTLYGYRVYGPYEPHNGHRFNHHKLLLDPYAKQLHGKLIEHKSLYAYDINSETDKDLTFEQTDSAPYMPKCVVTQVDESPTIKPRTRRRHTSIYELHVKGFSKKNPNIPVELQGTFAGLSDDASINYLVDLGITSVELLPIHHFVDEPFLTNKNLTNYWGYNSLSFFVVEPRYCYSADAIAEFQHCVDKFHQAGLEVILDVVYNHTAEGNELGRTLSFKGLDNASYYRLDNENKRHYLNHSGCGNTINISHPRVLQLVTDSLRYWVETMGVDGFRFDLAPILGRTGNGFSNQSHFFSVLRQDPTLATVKLIAEPWDIGLGGYQLGNFPPQWLEWNDRFRDVCRRFWRGDNAMVPEFAKRLHGSSDIFESRSRRPCSSVNFICSHDGFTLHDLVTYQDRHNEANGEQNLDGHGSNFSYNFGVEGETENVITNQLRTRQKRNLLTTLFIAQGTPMLLGGDEMGNSQQGNNNAYCQDNDIAWLDWQKADAQQQIEFTKQLIKLRKEHPLLNRTLYQHGSTFSKKTGLADISWLNSQGLPMQETDWHDAATKCFAMLLAQTEALAEVVNEENEGSFEQQDDALLIIFNAHPCEIEFQLPQLTGYWQTLINTAVNEITTPIEDEKPQANLRNTSLCVAAHSCIVLAYSHDVPDDFIENSIDE